MNSNKQLLLAIAAAFTVAANSADDDAGITPETIATATGELDVEGMPWDGRIHASTKTKTQKGAWTRRKGVADNVFDAITAELRQHFPAPQAAAPSPPPVTTTIPQVPSAPTIPTMPVAQPATPYTELTNFIAKNVGPQKYLTDAWIKDAFDKNSTSLAALASDMERSQQFLDAFRTTLANGNVAEEV